MNRSRHTLNRKGRIMNFRRQISHGTGIRLLALCLLSFFLFQTTGIQVIHADETCLILAHAGASTLAPENTRAAFEKAKEAGADGIETDVRMTRDHKLVLRHDEAIDRTSSGHGLISLLTLDELKSYDFGSWFDASFAGEKILTLDEGLAEIRKLGFHTINLELKPDARNSEELIRLTAESIERSGIADRVIVSSFDKNLLKSFHTRAPSVKTAILTIPDMQAISVLHLEDYLPKDKPLNEYTKEDVSSLPDILAFILRAFGSQGESNEDVFLDVIHGISEVAPEGADWSDVQLLIDEQADPVSFVDGLEFHPDYINCHHSSLTETLISAMNERGIGVMVWTPDSFLELQKTKLFQPDGVITNEPELARSVN